MQSFLIHEMAALLTDEQRAPIFEEARKLAAAQEALRESSSLQVVPYLGNLCRDLWPERGRDA